MSIELTPELAQELKAANLAAYERYQNGDDPWPLSEPQVEAMTRRIAKGRWEGSATITVESTTCAVLGGRGAVEAVIRAGVPIPAEVEWFP